MLKKWQLVLLIATILLFLSFNIFLVKKEHSKIDQVEYIESWTSVKQGDLRKVMNKPGVTVASEESHVYFDESMGAFNQFFVKEGDQVTRGSSLFEYSPNDIDYEISKLEAQLNETKDKISSLNSHISDLTDYKAELGMELDKEEEPNFRTSFHDLEREIYHKELEMDLLEDEASRLEDEIDELEDNMDSLTVKSEVDGIIKEINTGLGSPLITISATTTAVAGSIREGEMKEVSEGLKAIVTSHNWESKLNGTVRNVSKLPAEEPEVEKETVYPFKVELEAASDEILPGTHVAVEIITEEANGVLTAPQGSIYKKKKKEYVNILTPSGTIEKREIQTGIKVNGKAEIQSGVEAGEMVVIHKEPQTLEDSSKFITPIKLNKLDKPGLSGIKKDWRYILEGFLTR
ncbi:efflux RND transporter periplasmic adaptor subunit [Cytobacillus oceanisediminis]|uniref:efflux RND transporter periplasmic adaptor subunit n=1 Tax=Cytobacillus oceanisediminis TaxID=665099 RepID=UPI003735351E